MRSATELLATWESGLAAGAVHRAVLLHALVRGGTTGELLDVPVGRRDRDLFALRRALFGERLTGRVTCPHCETEQEFDFDVTAVLRGGEDGGSGEVAVDVRGWSVRLRLPTSADLLAVASAGPEGAKRALLARCVVSARRRGVDVPGDRLPPEVLAGVARSAADADPASDVCLTMPCVECGRPTRAVVDIPSFLWAELDAWARRTLLDVHLLASSYGWSEPDVLALSPTRRRHYLELVGHG
ncbi:hypothetical protein [Umezawaea beigongshangensis]|uniref:hypothetical protein n=1 Tax=Umezawaea beigongshangensis TaxID=2780383 RepID=UPI0018F13DE6|nr:hypothetical protein [Umezawaea beigongshangensis]